MLEVLPSAFITSQMRSSIVVYGQGGLYSRHLVGLVQLAYRSQQSNMPAIRVAVQQL
jgi:hypothetical protein